jgi:transcriptional regulator of acetoin/glycerol metabolism
MVEGTASTPWVQGWISDSWRRCIAQGFKADDALSFNPVSASHIKQALDQNRDLIQSAKPELERLGRAIAGTQFFALITDAQGVLLDLGVAIDRRCVPSGCIAASISSTTRPSTAALVRRCGARKANALACST